MSIFDILDPSFISELFSDSGKASLTEKLLVVGVVWAVMGRKISGHLKGIESRISQLTDSVNRIDRRVSDLEELRHAEASDNPER